MPTPVRRSLMGGRQREDWAVSEESVRGDATTRRSRLRRQ